VNIALFRGSDLVSYLVKGAPIGPSGAGSFTWQIPAGTATGSNYKIGIEIASNMNINDYSNNPFTIKSAPPTPSIRITSPNGGEIWQKGTTHTITWSYTGNPGDTVNIYIYKAGSEVNSVVKNVPIGTSGSGSYTWYIDPLRIYGDGGVGDDYKLKIQNQGGAQIYSDMSDNSFSLTLADIVSISGSNVHDGDKIYLPQGYAPDQCDVLVSPRYVDCYYSPFDHPFLQELHVEGNKDAIPSVVKITATGKCINRDFDPQNIASWSDAHISANFLIICHKYHWVYP
jgi:hypothetical protein